MNKDSRMMIRAAMLIHEHLAGQGAPVDNVRLPEHTWQQVQRLKRQLLLAQERSWRLAETAVFRNLTDALHYLQAELETAVRQLQTDRKTGRIARPVDVYRDIMALREEFDGLAIDLANHEIAVTTDAIVLEGIRLGCFEIRLEWGQIGSARQPYRVVAIDPHPAACNEEVTHPHVQEERLCEGEGRAAIAGALAEGRLCDFFTLVSQVLHTYGRGSAYVELDRWSGVPCSDCGELADEEDRYTCQQCGSSLCSSCAGFCPGCEESYCAECLRVCTACGKEYCLSCLTTCPGCRKRFCERCLEDGQCRPCYEKTLEEQDHDCDTACECEGQCGAGAEQARQAALAA